MCNFIFHYVVFMCTFCELSAPSFYLFERTFCIRSVPIFAHFQSTFCGLSVRFSVPFQCIFLYFLYPFRSVSVLIRCFFCTLSDPFRILYTPIMCRALRVLYVFSAHSPSHFCIPSAPFLYPLCALSAIFLYTLCARSAQKERRKGCIKVRTKGTEMKQKLSRNAYKVYIETAERAHTMAEKRVQKGCKQYVESSQKRVQRIAQKV